MCYDITQCVCSSGRMCGCFYLFVIPPCDRMHLSDLWEGETHVLSPACCHTWAVPIVDHYGPDSWPGGQRENYCTQRYMWNGNMLKEKPKSFQKDMEKRRRLEQNVFLNLKTDSGRKSLVTFLSLDFYNTDAIQRTCPRKTFLQSLKQQKIRFTQYSSF